MLRDVYAVTDIGDDIDDHWALSMLMVMPSVRLRLILCDSYSALARGDVLAEFLMQANISAVPIGIGVNRSGAGLIMKGYAQKGALARYAARGGPVYDDGVEALIKLSADGLGPPLARPLPRPVLLVISPCPSLRAALQREPRLGQRFDVFAMGGSVFHGLNASTPPQQEWNIKADPLAAEALYHAPWPLDDAPLDTAGSAQIDGTAYGTLVRSARRFPLIAALLGAYRFWLPRCPWPDATMQPLPANVSLRSSVLFDAVAVSMLPSFEAQGGGPFLDTETLKLRVTRDGWTRPDPAGGGRPVRCALRWRRRGEWQAAVVDLLTGRTVGSDHNILEQ